MNVTREQNKMVRKQIESHCFAVKNWIASAVESGDFDRAQALTKELRAHEAMFHIFVPDCMWEATT